MGGVNKFIAGSIQNIVSVQERSSIVIGRQAFGKEDYAGHQDCENVPYSTGQHAAAILPQTGRNVKKTVAAGQKQGQAFRTLFCIESLYLFIRGQENSKFIPVCIHKSTILLS
jgi:hypothetical protein